MFDSFLVFLTIVKKSIREIDSLLHGMVLDPGARAIWHTIHEMITAHAAANKRKILGRSSRNVASGCVTRDRQVISQGV